MNLAATRRRCSSGSAPARAHIRLVLAAAAFFGGVAASAQPVNLVKDTFPGISSTGTYDLLVDRILGVSGGRAFLSGWSLESAGPWLWVTDGTASGTRLLLDVAVSSGTDVNGSFLFAAGSQEGGALWKTDGTTSGSLLVQRFNRDPSGTVRLSRLTAVGSRLSFVADDGEHGAKLWTSDGTTAGTKFVTDLPPTPTGSSFGDGSEFVDVGGTLYFSCGPSPGCGLWKSDGTSAGTVPVASFTAASSLVNAGGMLFLSAASSTGGSGLWKSDGTLAGTVLVKGFPSVSGLSDPTGLVVIGGEVYFRLGSNASIWKSDGSEAGTVLVSSLASSPPLVPSGGLIFFAANGSSLYATDGSGAGTVLAGNMGTSFGLFSAVAIPGALLFWVDRGAFGLELWRSDGTPTGTSLVQVVGTGTTSPFPLNSVTLSGAALLSVANAGSGLFRSDGTAAGTSQLLDPVFLPNDGLPLSLTDANGTLFFSATDGAHGSELWRSNGTTGGTVLVKDINPGPDGSSPAIFFASQSNVFFRAFSADAGSELHRTDGTAAGTYLVKDILPGPGSGYIGNAIGLLGDLFLFRADDGVHGVEPWRSDGTPDGTFLLRDVSPGSASTQLGPVGVLGGAFYFGASDGTTTTLWKTNGTTAGTVAVGAAPEVVGPGVEVGGALVFPGSEPVHGRELWRTDGTAAGTAILLDINPTGDSQASSPVLLGGRVVFWADDGIHGLEPWTTDGTAAGTSLLKDIYTGPHKSVIGRSARLGSSLFFWADDGVHGIELWKTDGTGPGTLLVRDVAPGPAGSFTIESIVASGHEVFFTASDHVSGRELWRSDGTTAGTTRVVDLVPGLHSGLAPWNLTSNRPALERSGSRIYFTGTDGTTGYELWSLSVGTRFHTVAPCRVLDTRSPVGPSGGPGLAPAAVRAFPVAGRCGIPSTALSVAANVTVVSPSADGVLSLFAGGPVLTDLSEIPFAAGKTRAGNLLVGLGSSGSLSVRPQMPAGSRADLVVDVSGYFD